MSCADIGSGHCHALTVEHPAGLGLFATCTISKSDTIGVHYGLLVYYALCTQLLR